MQAAGEIKSFLHQNKKQADMLLRIPCLLLFIQRLTYSVTFFFFFGITFSVSTPRRFCHQTHKLGTKQME